MKRCTSANLVKECKTFSKQCPRQMQVDIVVTSKTDFVEAEEGRLHGESLGVRVDGKALAKQG